MHAMPPPPPMIALISCSRTNKRCVAFDIHNVNQEDIMSMGSCQKHASSNVIRINGSTAKGPKSTKYQPLPNLVAGTLHTNKHIPDMNWYLRLTTCADTQFMDSSRHYSCCPNSKQAARQCSQQSIAVGNPTQLTNADYCKLLVAAAPYMDCY